MTQLDDSNNDRHSERDQRGMADKATSELADEASYGA